MVYFFLIKLEGHLLKNDLPQKSDSTRKTNTVYFTKRKIRHFVDLTTGDQEGAKSTAIKQ